MSKTAKVRATTTSSGYGKIPVPKKRVEAPSQASFKPDMTATRKKRSQVPSAGYGRVTASKQRVDPDKFKPSFQPDMGLTAKARARVKVIPAHRYVES